MTADTAEPAPDGNFTSQTTQVGWDRDRIRRELTLRCEVRLGSGSWTKIDLINLTHSGFQMEWLPNCRPDSKVWIRMPGLQPLSATVRWRNNSGIGCEFSAPLYEPIFEHLVRPAKSQMS